MVEDRQKSFPVRIGQLLTTTLSDLSVSKRCSLGDKKENADQICSLDLSPLRKKLEH